VFGDPFRTRERPELMGDSDVVPRLDSGSGWRSRFVQPPCFLDRLAAVAAATWTASSASSALGSRPSRTWRPDRRDDVAVRHEVPDGVQLDDAERLRAGHDTSPAS